MTADIERIGLNDPSREVVINTLEEALSRVRNGDGEGWDYTKVLVILLDDENEEYNMGWSQGGMKLSECATLAKVAESTFIKKLGY